MQEGPDRPKGGLSLPVKTLGGELVYTKPAAGPGSLASQLPMAVAGITMEDGVEPMPVPKVRTLRCAVPCSAVLCLRWAGLRVCCSMLCYARCALLAGGGSLGRVAGITMEDGVEARTHTRRARTHARAQHPPCSAWARLPPSCPRARRRTRSGL
jgi:hypothetical protein